VNDAVDAVTNVSLGPRQGLGGEGDPRLTCARSVCCADQCHGDGQTLAGAWSDPKAVPCRRQSLPGKNKSLKAGDRNLHERHENDRVRASWPVRRISLGA
jgi:hypothetical protein